ncbi:hypothetical protein [Kitasatospora sp. NPDC056531]|uniref:hypothetical protein n=1 Tax=Kitasatospora sp. NPDC056531 TaxID=3345856 RepID=UPI0036A04C94
MLFSSRGQILSTITAFSLAAVAAFGISLTGAIQAVYERIWRLHAGGGTRCGGERWQWAA